MTSKTLIVQIDESRFRLPKSGLTIDLYHYPVDLTDGTISGIKAITTDGKDAIAVPGIRKGNYIFEKIPKGKYTCLISGPGIKTQIPEELSIIDTGLAYDVTGSEIPWKDNESQSISSKIEEIEQFFLLNPEDYEVGDMITVDIVDDEKIFVPKKIPKVYKAILEQVGTSAPTVMILENTIGEIVWTRIQEGSYRGTLTGAFPITKTFLPTINNSNFVQNKSYGAMLYYRESNNSVRIDIVDSFGLPSDNRLSEAFIEIQVYE